MNGTREKNELKTFDYEVVGSRYDADARAVGSRVCEQVINHVLDGSLTREERVKRIVDTTSAIEDIYIRIGCQPYLAAARSRGGDIASAIAGMLKENTDVQAVTIGLCTIGNAGAAELASALQANTKLLKFNILCDGGVGAEGMTALADSVKESKTLEHLSIRWGYVGDKGIEAIGRMLEGNTSLRSLSLMGTAISDTGARVLFASLDANATLADLYVEQCSLTRESVVMLAAGISRTRSLTTLVLADNDIGNEGAEALANVLALGDSSIRVLDLEGCGVGHDGVVALSNALAQDTSLSELTLSNNLVCDEGAAALADMLTQNSSLETLLLGNSEVGLRGALSLAQSCSKGTWSLKVLDLASCYIMTEGVAAMANALAQDTSMLSLSLSGNLIGEVGQQLLRTCSSGTLH